MFGDWKGATPPAPAAPANTIEWKPANIVVDMPEAGQAAVLLARPAIKRASPDYYAGLVANAALGSGFVSRLNREIRIKRGLSYGARSSIDARRDVGPFSTFAQTKNESAAEVAGLMQSELKRLDTEPVQGDELKSRKAVLTGAYARSLETNGGFVGKMSAMITYDLPLDTLNKFIPVDQRDHHRERQRVCREVFRQSAEPDHHWQGALLPRSAQEEFPRGEGHPMPELDLNRADLAKPKP